MEFQNTFVVQAPADEVWATLLDVERIAPCMPGASVLEQTGEDAYKVAVKVKVGPMTMNYKGDIEILERDADAHRATMRAKAKEARGQGTASASIAMALGEEEGGTRATIVTTMRMSGKAAAMGQGVIADVATSLTDTFARNLAQLMAGGEAEAPAEPERSAAKPAPTSKKAPTPTSSSAPAAQEQAGGPRPAEAPPRPARAAEPERATSEAEASLPLGQIVRSVVQGRLQDPPAAGALGLVLFALGVMVGRRRSR